MTQEPLWQLSDILNAETEGDAESPKRRGRIPQSAWPRILERYKAGATLSAIAREFDCTPSAISYIVRKAEAAGVNPDAGGGEAEAAAEPVTPTPPPPAAEAARPARRVAPREAKPEVESSLPPVAAAEPATPAPAPAAAPPAPETAAETHARDVLQHDSGRHEQRSEGARRFEGRENRPPREGRYTGEGGFEARGDGQRNENNQRADGPRGDRGQEGRRPPGGGAPRFPQGGQRDRFGDRQNRDRDRDRGEGNRPPRDMERQERAAFDPASTSQQPSEVVYPYRQQRNPARMEALETPSVPADERMDAAAKACAEAYRAWKAQADGGVQALGDAIHELRRVIARMEIEVSASRKEEQRPIPIHSYRTSHSPPQQPRG